MGRFNSRPRAAGDVCAFWATFDFVFQLTPARSGRLLLTIGCWRISGFNSRPRAAGDHGQLCARGNIRFQLTPARSGRLRKPSTSAGFYGFNSRPRAAGDFWLYIADIFIMLFQLTPARSGRLMPRANICSTHSFNSRPRAAGDVRKGRGGDADPVSTHARAQRATHEPFDRFGCLAVSTHARAQRATLTSSSWARAIRFQLTPARSGRRHRRTRLWSGYFVSTHARAQRATCYRCHRSEPHEFQLTPARSGRQVIGAIAVAATGFNSRPRAAGDDYTYRWQCSA